ncbi:histidinol-phosphate transaminase [Massilia sp. W12]|uniref:histidinol-phosphate transaminase n=1 Tax=Massilia sp. W12 TaxID=3126507 RepID=UPI0030D3A5E8
MTALPTRLLELIRPDVRQMAAYHVQDAHGMVKLDVMENPYHLPPQLRQQLGAVLAQVALNRYPTPDYQRLKQKIAERLGVPPGYPLILGNGSDELISLLALACAQKDADGRAARVLSPAPSFVMYAMSAQIAGLEFTGVPLQADFTLDMPAMLAAIAREQPALVYLSYPNNPTGNLFADSDIEAILQACAGRSLVVLDEAYQPFAQVSWMERLPQYPHMLVMRTVSKLGLAGIRLGYMSGHPDLLAQLEKLRPPFNVNVLTEAAANFALDHLSLFDIQAAAICQAREQLAQQIAAWPGVQVFPSAANFLLVRVADSERVFQHMLQHKVLIKNVGKMHTLLSNCLRITIGAPEENQAMLAALKAALDSLN